MLVRTKFDKLHIKDVPHNVEGQFFRAEKQTQVVFEVLEVRDFKNDHQFFLRSPDRKLVKNTFQRLFRASVGKKSWIISRTGAGAGWQWTV